MIIRPTRLAKVDATAISRLQASLRAKGLRESSIATHLRHIRSALSWAFQMQMLHKLPRVAMPKRARRQRRMKGRPISQDEFDRMLAACSMVRPGDSKEWRQLLEGLWLSGLRLGEALSLGWSEESPIAIDLTGKYPALRIAAEAEKGFRDRVLPIIPYFAQWLGTIPAESRVGKVFLLAGGWRLNTVSKIAAQIGRQAEVVVNVELGKFASAHDLRRAFGTRWAAKVLPAVLRQLMRHESIEATMAYYVDQNADNIAESLWNTTVESRFGL